MSEALSRAALSFEYMANLEQRIREQIAKEIEQACYDYCIQEFDIDGIDQCFYHRENAKIARGRSES